MKTARVAYAGAVHTAFAHDPAVRALLPKLSEEVEHGRLAASTAARNLLSVHLKRG